ncbi:MAG: T9SS type A sorting domain-containing protein [Bacteroidota bacterium]
MKHAILTLYIPMLIVCSVQAQWTDETGIDTLLTNQNVAAVSGIYANGDRFFSWGLNPSTFAYELFYTDTFGGTWTKAESDDKTKSYAAFLNVDEETMYNYGVSIFGAKELRISTDRGESWTALNPTFGGLPAFYAPLYVSLTGSVFVFSSLNGENGIFKSTDEGNTWTPFSTFDDGNSDKSIGGLFAAGSYFFLRTRNDAEGLYRVHKDSSEWKPVLELTDDDQSYLTTSIAGDRIVAVTDRGVEVSNDFGDTWTILTMDELGLEATGTLARGIAVGNSVLLSFQDSGPGTSSIWLVNLDTNTSMDITDGMVEYDRGSELFLMAAGETHVFATRSGNTTTLYKRDLGEFLTSNEEDRLEQPQEVSLSQNYPNPFNPTTNISFNLPSAESVRLTVYNMLGQQVATVANGRFASGQHTVTFNASALVSGMYVYRLQAGNVVETRKMMIVK